MNPDKNITQPLITCAAILLMLSPWILAQTHIRVPSDAVWLSYGAEHALLGHAMSAHFFEINPPPSFLVFIPAVFLKWLGIPLWQGITLYAGALSLLCLAFCTYFLSFWKLYPVQRYAILASYALAITVPASLEYGQKDHLIAIALLPFCLAQISISRADPVRTWIRLACLILLVPFIMIKPHYGLLCTAILAHRLYKNKSLKIMLHSDFLVLAITTIGYLLLIFYAFPDYLSDILPPALMMYVQITGEHALLAFSVAVLTMPLFLLVLSWPDGRTTESGSDVRNQSKNDLQKLAFTLSALGILSALPYILQGKGFSLHLLPYLAMTTPAIMATLLLHIPQSKQTALWAGAITLGVLALLATSSTAEEEYTHDYYRNHPLKTVLLPEVQSTTENAGETQTEKTPFYIESISTNIVLSLPEYLPLSYASRFCCNWFSGILPLLDEEHKNKYLPLFGDYIAGDINRFKPEVMLFLNKPEEPMILSTFADHTAFQEALSYYKEDGLYIDHDLNRIDFANGLIPSGTEYKVYRRK